MASSSASSVPAPSGSVITIASASASAAANTAACGTGSPCAACKFLRRKCQPDCVFAPYFPPDNPQKFVHVHRVFGASNVTKLLNELHPYQREDAVNSLAYEADMRLRDPVYGCVAIISILQRNLRQLQQDLARAKFELSKYQQAAAAAAAASASTGTNNGPHSMAEFIGNAVPNGAQSFINVGHSAAPRLRRWRGGVLRARAAVLGRPHAVEELRRGAHREARRQRRLRVRVLDVDGRRRAYVRARRARRRAVLEVRHRRQRREARRRPVVGSA
ncbi:hypothetical protein OsJ_04355 [Oryza sativa Japonica Group]|nr:hypothetical protein OsJ_04355 [Oryza sativa Japonica Group]